MRIIDRDIVAAIIISKDKKIFQGMKHPDKGGVYADCWHIPGGGIEKGESKDQALIREVREETGIDISPYGIILVDELGEGESSKILKETGEKVLCKMKFYVYKVEIKDTVASEIKVSLDDDLEKYIWTDISDLKNVKLTPPSFDLFKKLGYL